MREGVVSRGDLVNSVRNRVIVEEGVVIRRGVALPSCLGIMGGRGNHSVVILGPSLEGRNRNEVVG